MGYQFGAICYETASAAYDAYFIGRPPVIAGAGGTGGAVSITGWNLTATGWKFEQNAYSVAGVKTAKWSLAPDYPVLPTCTAAAASGATVADVFTIPITADLQTMFTVPFAVIMIVYLSAWAFARVLGFLHGK